MPRTAKNTSAIQTRLDETHRDYALLSRLESSIFKHANGKESFETEIPKLIRQSIDEVIDTPRSGRFTINQLDKTEKTYIGTKIEIILRDHLKLPRGMKLDVLIDGVEVDIKNTTAKSWMIPKEVIGHPCILIRADEQLAKCWFGLVMIREEILRKGLNRDKKSGISAANLIHVHWLLYGHDYPKNFWEDVTVKDMSRLTSFTSGTQRLVALFSTYLNRPMSREVVMALAHQKDSLKRLRKNGGARDLLQANGIALLSGKYHAHLISALGLPHCDANSFISVSPTDPEQIELLRKNGELP